jgi:hypothetical protein
MRRRNINEGGEEVKTKKSRYAVTYYMALPGASKAKGLAGPIMMRKTASLV